MNNKITPQQAFDAAKVLWPNLLKIQRQVLGFIVRFDDDSILTVHGSQIDWPEGVTQWPPPEHTWRDARMPEDWGKPARFRDSLTWRCDRTIAGYAPGITGPWIDSKGQTWQQCQVCDNSPVEVAEPIITKAGSVEAGDGWRILDRDEVIQAGDEFWLDTVGRSESRWCRSDAIGATVDEFNLIYRRKVGA